MLNINSLAFMGFDSSIIRTELIMGKLEKVITMAKKHEGSTN